MKNFDNETQFQQIVTKQVQQIENRMKGQPSSVNQIFLTQILRVEEESDAEAVQWLNSLTWQDFKVFRDKVFRGRVRYQSFCEGNIYEEQAVALTRRFVQTFESIFSPAGHLHLLELPERRCLMLSPESLSVYSRTNQELSEPNNSLLVYFQFDQNRERRAAYCFIESYLKSSFFNELRTKQQLGYVVSSSLQSMRGVFGFTFAVQSNHKLPEYCRERVDEYLRTQREKIRELTEKEFGDIVSGLLASVRKPYLSLFDQSDAHLDQILSMRCEFNYKQELERHLSELTVERVKSEFEWMFFGGKSRLELHAVAGNKGAEYEAEWQRRLRGERIPRTEEEPSSTSVDGQAELTTSPARVGSIPLLKKTSAQFPDVNWANLKDAVEKVPGLRVQLG